MASSTSSTARKFLMIMAFLMAFSISQAHAQQALDVIMAIDSNGIVHVEMRGAVEEGINILECPVEPIVVTMEALLGREVIPMIYYNNNIIVVSNVSGLVTVSYIANVTVENGKVSFYYNSTREATLIISPNILLIPGNLTLIDASIKDNKLFMKFRGPGIVSFVVTKIMDAQDQTKPPTPPTYAPIIPIGTETILYLVIIATVIVGALVIASKRRSKSLATYLDEVDKAIIEKLRKHGGETLQSLLYKELSLPKATIWRHIKKLERMGYVIVERMGRDSKVRLSK